MRIGRRGFLLGGGGVFGALAIGFSLRGSTPPLTKDSTLALGADPEGEGTDLTAWVRVAANGVVTLQVPASEMGQGVFTSLPLILAEELDVPWEHVLAETSPAHVTFRRHWSGRPGKDQMTVASETIRGYWQILREAGATARAMLVGAAADRWGVGPEDCATSAGVVTCGDRRATYGELAADAARRDLPDDVVLKDPSTFRLIGSDVPRLDLPPKVDGSALFGVDVVRPGMVVATPLRCPHFGGRLASHDDAEARAMPGVVDVLVVDDDTLVVVAETFWQAKRARDRLRVEWDRGPHGDLDSAGISAQLLALLDGDEGISVVSGDGVPAPTVEATYEVPYLEHAPMEPLSCTVELTDGRCDLWVSTQGQQPSQAVAAELTGLGVEQVFVHTTFLGGGFGRRSETDFVAIAVKVAQRVGRPVKVLWTREEQFAHGFYRPAFACRMKATVAGGAWTALDTALAGQNLFGRFFPAFVANRTAFGSLLAHEGLSDTPYAVPDQRLRYAPIELPVPIGFWRSVHGSHNAFFLESFVDEVAHAAGKDPIALRRELLADHPRQLAVLDRAVAEAGPVPEGQHRGVALFESFGSICAQVADVTVDAGRVRVHRVTAAIDCGVCVHPDTVRAQVQGGVGMGLSAALHEEITLANGAVVQSNFDDYRLLKLAEMPRVDVHVIASDEPPGGVGEPGLPPIAPALCNAIFAATGKRVRRLPVADQLA